MFKSGRPDLNGCVSGLVYVVVPERPALIVANGVTFALGGSDPDFKLRFG